MKSFRTVLFWMHLAAGASAGVVVLIMSVTGVALTYEKQMLEWADRRAWIGAVPGWRRATCRQRRCWRRWPRPSRGRHRSASTLRADRRAPATVTLRGQHRAARRSLHRRDHRRTAGAALRASSAR